MSANTGNVCLNFTIDPSVGINFLFLSSFVITYPKVKSVKLPACFFNDSDAELSTVKSSTVKFKSGAKKIFLYCSNSVPRLRFTIVFSYPVSKKIDFDLGYRL